MLVIAHWVKKVEIKFTFSFKTTLKLNHYKAEEFALDICHEISLQRVHKSVRSVKRLKRLY